MANYRVRVPIKGTDLAIVGQKTKFATEAEATQEAQRIKETARNIGISNTRTEITPVRSDDKG